MTKLSIVFLVLIILVARGDGEISAAEEYIVQICGQRLAKMVGDICDHNYTTGHRETKKSLAPIAPDDAFESRECRMLRRVEDFNNRNELERMRARPSAPRKRKPTGIVAECCKNACTYSHIRKYYCN